MEPLLGLDFKNFQSLKDTQLNLDPGLNVIVGPSNLGKSAAIRGLKALVYNAPATGLIRQGSTQLELTAWFGDGQKISLIKGKNKSEYCYNGDVYAKAGANEAPEIVQKHWGIATPDKRMLSFASQHETPFLLNEPASAVTKVLGDLTNASMLMDAVQRANKLRREAEADQKARHREAVEATEALESHKGIRARGEALQAAREAYRAAHDAVTKRESVREIAESYQALSTEQAELSQSNIRGENLTELVEICQVWSEKLTTLLGLRDEYETLTTQAASLQDDVWHLEDKIADKEKELQTILEQAGTCPVCGQEVH